LREADSLAIATRRDPPRWLAGTASMPHIPPTPSSTVGSRARDLPARKIMPFSTR
jgi:hypothetical protein